MSNPVRSGRGAWQLVPKISPATGKQDDGEYLEINTEDLPATTSTVTATIQVSAAP